MKVKQPREIEAAFDVVWIVELGEYSHRGIDAVFATKDLAVRHALARNGSEHDVSEYRLLRSASEGDELVREIEEAYWARSDA